MLPSIHVIATRLRFIVFICLTSVGAKALDSATIPDTVYCPTGAQVEADTISYLLTSSMPFDRCFYLKYTLPGSPVITAFSVLPIDKNGSPDFKRRDRRIFFRSGWKPGPGRRSARQAIPYSEFKKGRAFSLLEPVKQYASKGGQTVVILKVPPLDPGREYKILLLSGDDKVTTDLLKVAELIFRSLTPAPAAPVGAPPPPTPTDLQNEAVLLHNHNIAQRKYLSNRETFSEFVNTLFETKVEFTGDRTEQAPYKVFFTPAAPPAATLLTPLDESHFYTAPKTNPSEFFLKPIVNLTAGTVTLDKRDTSTPTPSPLPVPDPTLISLNTPVTYNINILRSALNASGTPTIYLDPAGALQFENGGSKIDAVAKAETADGRWLKTTPSVIRNFRLIEDKKTQITTFTTTATGLSFNAAAVRTATVLATACPCEEKGIRDLRAKDDLLNTLSLFFDSASELRKEVAGGFRSLANLAQDAPSLTAYEARSANLKASIGQLNTAIEFLRKARLLEAPPATTIGLLIPDIVSYRTNLDSIAIKLKFISARQAASKKFLSERLLLREGLSATTGSTSMLNLVSENKFRIIPEFGFVVLFRSNKLYSPQDFSPYLGFSVGLRPIDKNIPFRMIRYKTWRHRLSFISGITLRSLEIKNERENFINGSNLITGLGYRLNNYLQLNGGGVWFKAYDSNPLSDKRPILAAPYLGISADLELQELFGGIKSLFTKL